MKVERKGSFTPITITLETEEEAKILWICLNNINGVNELFERYFRGCKFNHNLKHDMWTKLDDNYSHRKS